LGQLAGEAEFAAPVALLALSIEPAEAIAGAAPAFGQSEDISVLTLSFAGIPVCA
jgi:hypothetical protein